MFRQILTQFIYNDRKKTVYLKLFLSLCSREVLKGTISGFQRGTKLEYSDFGFSLHKRDSTWKMYQTPKGLSLSR